MMTFWSVGLYTAFVILVFDGVLKVVDSTAAGTYNDRRSEGVPFGLLRSHVFNWGAHNNQNKRYVIRGVTQQRVSPLVYGYTNGFNVVFLFG